MKLFHLICVVAVALTATTNVHALDGGPATGGTNSLNPNNRSPRTESASTPDGGPMSGSTSSTNPNAGRPASNADGGPATSSTDAGPPMAGGDMSTNPNARTRTPSPMPTTVTPTVTTASPTPVATTKAPATTAPSPTTDKPPATITDKPPATITDKPPASITEKPPATLTPSAPKTNDTSDAVADDNNKPTPQETGVLDFSVLHGDKSDVVGEVSADYNEDLVHVVPSKDATTTPASGETAGDADTDVPVQKSESQAVTPSPVSKKNSISNTGGMSSASRSGYSSMASVVVATFAVTVATALF